MKSFKVIAYLLLFCPGLLLAAKPLQPMDVFEFEYATDAQLIELDKDCGHGDPWCAADEFSTLERGFLNGP